MTGQTTAGTAGDGYRVPPPRDLVEQRLIDDPDEPGARRSATTRTEQR